MAANAEYNGLVRDRKHGVEQGHGDFCILYKAGFVALLVDKQTKSLVDVPESLYLCENCI